MKTSTKDRVQGQVKEAKGAIRQTVGAAVGDRDLELKGKVQKNVGKVQGAVGRVEKVVGK